MMLNRSVYHEECWPDLPSQRDLSAMNASPSLQKSLPLPLKPDPLWAPDPYYRTGPTSVLRILPTEHQCLPRYH